MNVFKKNNIVSFIENPGIPLSYYILSFFAFLAIENFLEIFSDTAVVSFRLLPFSHRLFIAQGASIAIHFLHCSLWWIVVALIFPIVFTCITRENIDRTMRAALSFSWIVLITPIVDLILSRGRGINIHYIYPESIADFLRMPQGLTPGENLTAAIALILAFIYCLIKTRKITKAIFGTSLICLGVILAFLLPFLIEQITSVFQIGLESITPILIIRLLVSVILIESLFIFYLKNKGYFLLILKQTGPLKVLHFILIFILGMLLFRSNIGRFILENAGCFLLSLISITLGWAVATIFNNLETQQIPQAIHKTIALGIFSLALLCAISVNFTTLFFVLLGIGVSFVYCLPPLKLKRMPIFSKIFVSFGLLLAVILGWLFAGGEILEFPHIFSLYFLVFWSGCLNLIDLNAVQKNHLKTLPAIFGEKRSKLFISFVFLISYLLIPWLFLEKLLLLPALIFGLTQFYLINRKNYQERYILLTSLLGLIALTIWLNSFRSLFYSPSP
ncbi:MAG: UbiA prenyltransferase family protein [Candidatus Omnitrophica bacterium]|nr:UbiA prenyltransferase family protein [Candidatus Omnitrophota bacterium]